MTDDFAADAPRDAPLVLELDGYEGPIDLLLALAREQKVDLGKISILALADQYLAFISGLHRLRLEIAADYLVMAAWLAYLKSRLLLPDPPAVDDEPSAEELAAALHQRLQLLAAMQRAGAALMAGTLLGRDVFPRGQPEEFAPVDRPVYELSLFDLLSAYGTTHRRQHAQVLTIMATEFYSLDDGLRHLAQYVGHVPEWSDLMGFLPAELRDGVFRRSAVASTFAATLELARAGRIELRQERPFGPLLLRSAGGAG
ncbi:MAG TPA: ScpA family protein [Stellaceae bacterium]|jgi:segregation and condensation protein A|nr:ScpA family protein [Stellaceae bacterium]